MVVVSCVISQCQQVRYLIFGNRTLFQKFLCESVYLIIDEGTGNQPAEFIDPFAVELIFKGLIPPFGQERISIYRMYRFPHHIADAKIG